jgi:hypothetical protein
MCQKRVEGAFSDHGLASTFDRMAAWTIAYP